MPDLGVYGLPGIGTAKTASWRRVLRSGEFGFLGQGKVIDGTKTRDVGNTGFQQYLRAGLLMGKISASGLYANSIIGLSQGALTGAGTTLTTNAAIATELNRRIGATGTFKLTGPASAGGTVRSLTATYSALNLTSGDVTITALGANQVDQININPASTGGNLVLTVQKTDGTFVTTGNMAWSATDATYLGNINTALDTATGVTGGIVASAIPSVDTDLGIRLTYSGTGYAGKSWTPAQVELLPTSSTNWALIPVTTAVNGAFVTGSLIQPTDGSETPLSVIPDGYPLQIVDASGNAVDTEWAHVPIAGELSGSQIIDWPADTALRTWIEQALSTLVGGKFTFGDVY